VRYVAADLLDLPSRWRRAFDIVVECTTVQSLPPEGWLLDRRVVMRDAQRQLLIEVTD